MRNTIFIILTMLLISSCSQTIAPDAYGNFEDDATTVSANNAGQLVEYKVEDGKHYKKDDIVGVVDTMQLHLKKEVLIASMSTIDTKARNVESQKSVLDEQLANELLNQKRIKNMVEDGAATTKQLDDINAAVSISKQRIANISIQRNAVLAEKRGLNAQIQQIDDLIKKSLIVIPIDGTVLLNFAKLSEFVAPGKPLFTIQDTKTLSLTAYIAESQLSEINVNQKVSINIDKADSTNVFIGTIYWISSKAEFTPKQIQTKEERRNLVYSIKIKVPNTDGSLKIGMPADVNF